MDPLRKAAQKPILILMSVFIAVFSFLGWHNETNTNKIDLNTSRLKMLVDAQCLQDQQLTKDVNQVYETLISAVARTKSIPEAEKADRILKYKRQMSVSPVCIPMDWK